MVRFRKFFYFKKNFKRGFCLSRAVFSRREIQNWRLKIPSHLAYILPKPISVLSSEIRLIWCEIAIILNCYTFLSIRNRYDDRAEFAMAAHIPICADMLHWIGWEFKFKFRWEFGVCSNRKYRKGNNRRQAEVILNLKLISIYCC